MKFRCYFDSPLEMEDVLLSKGWYFDCNHALRKHDASLKIYGWSEHHQKWVAELVTECQGIVDCLLPWRELVVDA